MLASMKKHLVLLLAVGAAGSVVTPVSKVITMLTGMCEKGKKEKQEEQVWFAGEKQFCADAVVEKDRSIEKAKEAVELLTADITKFEADIALLGKQVAKLDVDTMTWEGDKAAATKVRGIENADYQATHKEYSESIDAIARAVKMLKAGKKSAHKEQASDSLAQVEALKGFKGIPADAVRTIDAFLSTTQTAEVEGAPEANAYEFQSSGVIDMLEKLGDKFSDERNGKEKQESNSKHAHQMLIQNLVAQLKQSKADRGQKVQAKSKALASMADSKGNLQDTQSTLQEDTTYVSHLRTDCRIKASEFESRQQLRSEEITAVEKAIEILNGGVVKPAEKHLPQLMQMKTAFTQLRSSSVNLAQERATMYLQEQAKQLNSRVLSAMANRLQDDPFGKVKNMIKDLIVRLLEAASGEASHKGWCDKELAENKLTRTSKTQAVEMLTAELDQLDSSVSDLSNEITQLNAAVADLDKSVSKKTAMRHEEKAAATATIEDAQNAQTAVAQALVVLKEFFAKAAESASLVQTASVTVNSQSGVIAMLEVVESDFARLESETSAGEVASQKSYDTFMTESKVDKAKKNVMVKHKVAKKQAQELAHNEKAADLVGTQKELTASLSVYDKLKPSCIDAGVSYEERVARRKEEIQSLQEAMKILNADSA